MENIDSISVKEMEKHILSDAELKGRIDSKLNQSLAMNSNGTVPYHFDQLSTLETLLDHLKPLIHSPQPMLNDSIRKTCHLLIDTFMTWFRSLSFSSLLKKNLYQHLLDEQWPKYLLLVLCYFLAEYTLQHNRLSTDEVLRRLFEYQKRNYFPANTTSGCFQAFWNFLGQFSQLNLSQTEFTLLSILLVLRTGRLR